MSWDGKEKRTTAPTATLRRKYRWNRFLDGLAEKRYLIAVAIVSIFLVLGVMATSMARVSADGEKTRALMLCIVHGFQAPNPQDALDSCEAKD